jgi:hypothetical protein
MKACLLYETGPDKLVHGVSQKIAIALIDILLTYIEALSETV